MKTTQSSGTRPEHKPAAGTFEFKFNGKAIVIGFTEQPRSPHAGSALFWGGCSQWTGAHVWRQRLESRAGHHLERAQP